MSRWMPSADSPWLGPWFGVAVALVLWLLLVFLPGPFSSMELFLERQWLLRSGPTTVEGEEPRIVIVTMDEDSYAWVQENLGYPAGQWSREVYATALRALRELGARAIGFDVVMSAPREGDDAFARELAIRRDTVLAAVRDRASVSELARGAAHKYLYPAPALAEAARVGHVKVGLSRDGAVRRASLYMFRQRQEPLSSWDYQLAHVYHRGPEAAMPPAPRARDLRYGAEVRLFPETLDHRFHVDPESQFLIRYRGSSPAFPEISMRELLDPVMREEMLWTTRVPAVALAAGQVQVKRWHEPGTRRLRLRVHPEDQDVEVLAVPEREGPWAAARGRGSIEVSGLGEGPYKVFVARALGEGAWGILQSRVEEAGGKPLVVQLPEPTGRLRGRVVGAEGEREVLLEGIGIELEAGSYREVLELRTDEAGRFEAPRTVEAELMLHLPGGSSLSVERDAGELDLNAAQAFPTGEERPPLEIPDVEAGTEVLVLGSLLPIPPYHPMELPGPGADAILPGPPDPRGQERMVLLRDPNTGRTARGQSPATDDLRDAVVLIGDTTEVSQDLHFSPYDLAWRFLTSGSSADRSRTPGVEIHAHAIRTLLLGLVPRCPTGVGSLGDPNPGIRFVDQLPLLVLLLAIGAVGGLLMKWTMPGKAAGVLLALLAAHHELCFFLYAERQTWLHAAVPMVALIVVYVALLSYNFAVVERRRREIRSAFEHYLDPDIVQELTDNPDALQLGGSMQQVTCFFSDIESFSSFSEVMTPPQLIDFINEYLTAMSDVLIKYGGWLDKFIGDAIVAVFNAPRSQPDHACRCILAALEMKRREEELREEWRERGLPEVKTRIGINTGGAVVGNVGTDNRKSYTILGDAVNLAARLEALNKSYGTYLMVGEATWRVVEDGFDGRELDRVRVKGKKVPVGVYEVWAPRGEQTEAQAGAASLWAEALEAYRNQAWDEATKRFEAVLALLPGDGPTGTYLKRITLLRENPPGEDWDGVWTMEHK